MNTKRAHILLPEELVREIDALVGPRGRSSFLVETARNEVRRQKLLLFLDGKGNKSKELTPAWKEPAWKEKNHPELGDDAAAWVRKIRTESETGRKRNRR